MTDNGTNATDRRLTRADLEDKFRKLQEDVQGRISDKRESIMAAAGVAGALIFVVAYLLGRRAGRRKRRKVEFRGF